MSKERKAGFSLIELLIVLSIMGILVALAIPSYKTYTRRAHYAEIVQAAAPFKLGVHECYAITGELPSCHNGENGVPPDIMQTAVGSLVASVTTTNNGTITVTPKARFGINAQDTYQLIPTAQDNQLTWHIAGGGVKHGYAG